MDIENNYQLLDDELLHKMQVYFVTKNHNTVESILDAIDNGDIKLAFRLAHSLKGNSGQIGKIELHQIAGTVEKILKAGKIPPDDLMETLKTEMVSVLDDLKPLVNDSTTVNIAPPMSDGETQALLNELSVLLEQKNTRCLKLLGDLTRIPGTDELITQIEDYDFGVASQTLKNLIEAQ